MMDDARRSPAEEPVERRIAVNDVTLAVYEWPGAGPPVLFAHATGFHARCWDEVIRRLPGRRAISIDMRGHGRSEKPEGRYGWQRFGEDVRALTVALDLDSVVGVGHSMGGHSVTYAAGHEPARFAALVLIDPVIGPREAYERSSGETGAAADPTGNQALDADRSFITRRRNEWESPEEMFQRFSGRPPFSRWEPRVLRDYCEWGLMPGGDDAGSVLACPPAVEAEIYANAMGCDISDEIAALDLPARVLRAVPRDTGGQDTISSSPTDPGLAARFRSAADIPLPDATHFIPMETPGLVARHVIEVVAAVEK